MLVYNTHDSNRNPFGFDDIKNESIDKIKCSRPRATKRAASSSKSLKNKLSKENIEFLKSLGFKVKVK